MRNIPTEIPLGEDQVLGAPCAAAFDKLHPIRRSLTERVGTISEARREICQALRARADC